MEKLDSCPICLSNTLSTAITVKDHSISKETFNTSRCDACGFLFTNPRPSDSEIGPFYKSEDYISHSNTSKTLRDKLYKLARKRALKQKFGMVSEWASRGELLDYGCGTGEFLAYMSSRGFKTTGFEPDLSAREQAIRNHGLTVNASLSTMQTQEQYRIITLWHVLEHVHALSKTLKWFYAALHPEGTMLVAVPNIESWDAQYYKEDWAALDVPRHLYHFRKTDITTLFNKHGFDVAKVSTMQMDALYISMLSEQYKGAGPLSSLAKGTINGIRSNIAAVGKKNTSSLIYILRKSRI